MSVTMRSICNFAAALTCCAALGSQTFALTQAESDEIDDYLATYMKNVNVLKQVINKDGEVISCVDIDRQPGMNHPSWSGTVHREMSPEGTAMFPGIIVPAPASAICPDGTVEMRLPTRAQIIGAGGLRRFLSK
jgi:hypothetical protein